MGTINKGLSVPGQDAFLLPIFLLPMGIINAPMLQQTGRG